MKGLRNYINSIKPNFVGEGKYSKWFPLFDAVENFVFSTQTKTSNPVHVRDGVDIQKIMVIVWLSTFPAMFFGMYNLCLLYTSPSPRDRSLSRMPSSA